MHIKRKIITMDGNNAAAWAAYPFTEFAAVYPITPSSVMAEVTDRWAAEGRKNLFGSPVTVTEMQSEAGAAGAVHGAASAGALTATYTASQGLLLMIPDMYKIAGELLPNVIHVSARCVSTHALSIFGDHSDIYACRQTGYAMLCSSSPQEVMDLAAAAHLISIESSVPFIHFFDGFRTSHEIQKIEVWDMETLEQLLDRKALAAFRRRGLNPERPFLRGSAQNPDIFFQNREACNSFYDRLPQIAENCLDRINALIGTDYRAFSYYGASDAEHIIIAMGSVCETIEETVDYLNGGGGKFGLVKVRLYRPFSAERLVSAIPETVRRISVLSRTKEPGAVGEPLYLDVCAALRESRFAEIPVFSGRYGLASKDTDPAQIIAVFRNKTKKQFTIGIEDDVTGLSLDISENPDTSPAGTFSCKFWGLGSDGTVGANKNSVKIIGDNTELHVQAYFSYDSKKSGGVTVSHLRFGKNPIKSAYLVNHADFVACHNQSYIGKYYIVTDIRQGGTFLLNTSWSAEELEEYLPADVKRYLAQNKINFFIIDGVKIAEEIGMGGRINTILQAAFFRLTDILPYDRAAELMKKAVEKTYGGKGRDVVEMNFRAIDAGGSSVVPVKIPESWASAQDDIPETVHEDSGYISQIQKPCMYLKGDRLPVSAFAGRADGAIPSGTSAFEKRGIAVRVPQWIPENCIQCCQCSLVCPHAVIRPAVLSESEAENAPEQMQLIDFRPAMNGLKFGIVVSVMDCTGCSTCAQVCPARKKALEMKPFGSQAKQQEVFRFAEKAPEKPEVLQKFPASTVKGSQFRMPLFEFSGACAGCGESAYAKLVTQLFGDRMYIANATGCSSIWGGSAPSNPYTFNFRGRGPAWASSLFEDNAEFGFGMHLAVETLRKETAEKVRKFAEKTASQEVKSAAADYFRSYNDIWENLSAADRLADALESCGEEGAAEILAGRELLGMKSQWIFGGDGWAYDIGFGGLDHVLASGKNVNILVFDTEVYSNTGGQASKATPAGAAAQFAVKGKYAGKKNLAAMAMTYGNVYVAQVSMGADMNQCVRAFCEAGEYDGVSLIIAYSPCINHGIRKGMGAAQQEEKNAVECGYWQLLRYNPAAENPLSLDSKAPDTEKYREFLMGELRFSGFRSREPERWEMLMNKSAAEAVKRYNYFERLKNSLTD